MWMDAIVAVVFVFSTAAGLRHGFVRTIVHTLGWISSLIFGLLFHAPVYKFLRFKTGLYEIVFDKVTDRITEEGNYAAGSFISDMPVIIQQSIEPIKNGVASAIASGIAEFLFKMISLIIIIIIMRFVFSLINLLFSKKHNRGIIGFLDSIAGFVAGMVKGLFLVFLFLTLLVPLIGLYNGSFLYSTLESSMVASVLYDNNYLLLIMKSVFR